MLSAGISAFVSLASDFSGVSLFLLFQGTGTRLAGTDSIRQGSFVVTQVVIG